MSGSTSVAVPASGAGGISGYRPPFTAVQWQELEHQALIYKYLVAGVPVPYDLVVPIRRSLEALSARFFNHPNSIGYCSYYGKKFDPEPGRCRRTDGKKWRCSKDAYPDSKYCERHMHRGRNRSRKPVESQSASQSLSTAVSHITSVSGSSSGNGSFQSVNSGSFQYPAPSSGSIDFGSNVSKLRMDTSPYGINNNFRYAQAQGLTVDVDDQTYSSGASGSADSNTWRLMPTTPLMKSRNNSFLQNKSAFDPMVDPTAMTKPSQQHCLFGSKIGSPVEAKQMRPFFDEWPEAREPWSTTQLSMSTAPEYPARNECTPNDA